MKKKLLIIQEYFPVYRKPFFDMIAEKYNLTVIISKSNFSDMNAEKNCSYIKEVGNLKSILSGRFFWQRGVIDIDFSKYDIVVLSAAPRNLSFLYLMFYLKFIGKQTVFWGQYWSATSSKIGYIIRMLLLKLASGVLFYTEKECIDYKKSYLGKNDKRRISGLNNGLDINEIKLYCEKFDIEKRTYNILFIGRLTEKSYLIDLINAIGISKFSNIIKLHIIGDGPIRVSCEDLINKLNLKKQIVMYGALKNEKLISDVVNKCSLFVYPGNVGLSLIHAMSYGLPCIIHDDVYRHGPEVSAIFESCGGQFYRLHDIQSLVNIIDDYFLNTKKMEEHSEKNLNIITKTYNVSDMFNRFYKFIEGFEYESFNK